ncbi:MAG: abortive infection family protein [Mogibacterium sp.]|nr:abortive infection family protein [Mogibacterium sp.]
MADNNQYWNQLISNGIRFLQEQNNDAAAAVLKKAAFDVEHTYHDSWRWGTDYWALGLYLKHADYKALGKRKEQVERDIMSALVTFQKGSRDLLSTVTIRPLVEQNVEWSDVLPFQKAAEDAEAFMREGNYDHAFDRIHTAFSDYIKHILAEHDVYFETDESVCALLTNLQEYYCSHVQPSDAGERIKTILLNTGGIIDTLNELRNNSTAAHPDGQMIEKREAQLAIGLINSIVDYIDDIEKELIIR